MMIKPLGVAPVLRFANQQVADRNRAFKQFAIAPARVGRVVLLVQHRHDQNRGRKMPRARLRLDLRKRHARVPPELVDDIVGSPAQQLKIQSRQRGSARRPLLRAGGNRPQRRKHQHHPGACSAKSISPNLQRHGGFAHHGLTTALSSNVYRAITVRRSEVAIT